ncbi:MAG: alkaline phosphatase family protein [Phycisphaerales bacterium]|nr:alkaline phosphatase family protein [Phycisphaerales bacterium]
MLFGCSPARTDTPIGRIAFGSCAKQDRPQPIWDAVIAGDPDLFLFIGDNIYADTENPAVMQAKYAQLNAMPGFQRLRRTCPILATWDDHDYGVNDGGREYPMREKSQRLFLESFNVPRNDPRWHRPGVYSAHLFGPPGNRVQIILLDTRYFRSPLVRRTVPVPAGGPYAPNPDPSATMLGPEQWTWLEQQLRQSADVRILASSTQVLGEDHTYEKWGNMPHELARLIDLIRRCRAENIVFISGDMHSAELTRLDEPGHAPLYELTSSGMNCAIGKDFHFANRRRVGPVVQTDNFAMIHIDWVAAPPRITLEIRDVNNAIQLQHVVTIDIAGVSQ